MKEINPVGVNVNPGSGDEQLRWRSTTDEVVKFAVTAGGTKATVNGEPATLPLGVAVNTDQNAIYMLARTHRLLAKKDDAGEWQVAFLGPEYFRRLAAKNLSPGVQALAPLQAPGACTAEACAAAAPCPAAGCAGDSCGALACSGLACAGATCAADACGAHACGADACAAAACPANACGLNACLVDAGLLPCPAEACLVHAGIPECPFIL